LKYPILTTLWDADSDVYEGLPTSPAIPAASADALVGLFLTGELIGNQATIASYAGGYVTKRTSQALEPRFKWKWIALGIGGGCALLACAGLLVALAVTVLIPTSSFAVPLDVTRVKTLPVPPLTVQPSTPTSTFALQQSGNTLGDPNAPVKVIEYADFQCPYCRRFWQETEPQIIATYVKSGKVFYEYRSVGAFLGQESADAAEAAYCAGDQGRFWDYHDALFLNWTGENVGDFTKEKLDQYARSLRLDSAAFEQCLTSGRYAARVQQDVTNARKDGVHATPSFLINGKLVEGAMPFSAFQEAIDAALHGQ
jgi:protein-disulfide isomerase